MTVENGCYQQNAVNRGARGHALLCFSMFDNLLMGEDNWCKSQKPLFEAQPHFPFQT